VEQYQRAPGDAALDREAEFTDAVVGECFADLGQVV
jgi:hypothetical protein